MTFLSKLLWACIALQVALGNTSLPDVNAQASSNPARAQLQREIGLERSRINLRRERRTSLQNVLGRSERQAGVVILRMRQIHSQLASKRRKLADLQQRRSAETDALVGLRTRLSAHLRTSYMSGNRDYLKLLLNQEDPFKIARAVAYHGYVSRARSAQISENTVRIRALTKLEDEMSAEARTLAVLLERATAAQEELAAERNRRKRLLEPLDAEIATAAERLADLRKSERSLGHAVAQVKQEKLVPGPETIIELPPFPDMRGKLLWPTRGQIPRAFSNRGNPDDLHWQGVLITAPYGQPVHAVAPGRIAFADWIRGFGFVVIIEHGEDFMSLYGHAREVLHEAGAWVQKDEVIAAVGDTGGRRKSGLYFEIRKSGKPLNPHGWCAGTPAQPPSTLARR